MSKNKFFDSFGDRMKKYEEVSNIKLVRRMPVILRLDMCHGHSFTKGFVKPFDKVFTQSMQETMLELCKNIDGAVFGYTQSDEITIVLVDYKSFDPDGNFVFSLNREPWFDNRVEKLCSVSASKATRFFNKAYIDNVENMYEKVIEKHRTNGDLYSVNREIYDIYNMYKKKYFTAEFDARAFNIPREEVCNNILWRQKDAERNSISGLAQSLFSQKELNGVGSKGMQNKMLEEKGVNWNDLATEYKRGCACVKVKETKTKIGRAEWIVDKHMPVISEAREYVEAWI